MRRRLPFQLIAIVVLIVVASTARCGDDGGSDTEFPDTSGFESPASSERITLSPDSLIAAGGPERIAKSIADQWGREAQLFEVTIHDTHASMRVRDPVKPENVDDYSFRDGKWGDQRPVHTSVRDDLDAQTFRFGTVKWDAIAGLVTTAVERLKIDDAAPTHVNIDRDESRPDGVTIRVYVSGPRRSGYLTATGNATIVAVEQG